MKGPKHILLVEDNEDDAFLMQQARKRAGVSTPMNVVVDGKQAIAYLKGEAPFQNREEFPAPHLVLLDLRLPYIPGHEVLEWIRQQPGLQTLIVVVLTASSDSSDIERAYRLGANSYLVKPSSVDQLTEMVRRLEEYWLHLNHPPADAPAGAAR